MRDRVHGDGARVGFERIAHMSLRARGKGKDGDGAGAGAVMAGRGVLHAVPWLSDPEGLAFLGPCRLRPALCHAPIWRG